VIAFGLARWSQRDKGLSSTDLGVASTLNAGKSSASIFQITSMPTPLYVWISRWVDLRGGLEHRQRMLAPLADR
jgi:hypothetical protein